MQGTKQVFVALKLPCALKTGIEMGRKKCGMRSASEFIRTAIESFLASIGITRVPDDFDPMEQTLFDLTGSEPNGQQSAEAEIETPVIAAKPKRPSRDPRVKKDLAAKAKKGRKKS